MALPFLEAMLPRKAYAAPSATRLLAYYVPNGIHMQAYTPSTEGANYQLTPILAPLAPVKEDVLVISGLRNNPARPDGPGDHAAGTGSFLTCAHVRKTEGSNIRNGVSMDQVVAQAIGDQTALPSMQLGSHGGGSTGNCDSGYSCAYARNVSWAGEQTPLAKETNPQAVFDRLFQGGRPGESAETLRKKKKYRLSILDFVKDDAQRLKTKLGKTDQLKVDEYLTGVRNLEREIQAIDTGPMCSGSRPDTIGNYQQRVQAMADIMVTALQCDKTRVISFMLGNAGSNQVYSWLGVNDGHHQISHHQNNQRNFEQLQTISTWEIEQLSYLLQRLKATPDGEGNLLDNTMVFWSSEISDGNRHNHDNLPVIVAGRGGGAIRPGRHLRVDNQTPIANLFISLIQGMGVNANSFGDDGTGPLTAVST